MANVLCYNIGMKRFQILVLLGVLSLGVVAADVPAVFDVWRQPQVWPRHMQLRNEFLNAIRRGDTKAMEASSRGGVELMPEDPTWRYNHACALAYREQPGEALNELEQAVRLGFRNANAIEKDNDFARVNELPRFKEIVALAKKLEGQPIPGRPEIVPAYAKMGGTVTLTATNVAWNFDTGFFEAKVETVGDNNPSPFAEKYAQSRTRPADCPERPYVAAWLSEGTGAGNGGDLYLNRDRGHSLLATRDFPLLTTVALPAEARKHGVDLDLPNMLFGGEHTVLGNASRARLGGPFWRSDARAAMLDPHAAAHMNDLYLNNQLWFFPAHMDFGKEGLGDVFPCLTPHMFISVGSSYTDQPFLRAAAACSASFIRPTKQGILRRRLMGPTLQWILRRTRKGVDSEKDYLTAKAHPTAFAAKDLDIVKTVKFAHALRPDQIPPVVSLALVNSKMFPIRMPVPIRDYPDPNGEVLLVTPTAIAFALRGLEAERTFLFQARTIPEKDPTATFAWRVVGGDAKAVRITPPLGETLATPESGLAQITIDRRHLTNRIDLAVFAKSHGTEFGAPSFITFMPIPSEKREYDAKGKLLAIDNTNAEGRYVDPFLALPRPWKDVFHYDKENHLLGYTRTINGKPTAEFTATGQRIVEKNPDGSPRKTVRVRYLPRANRVANPNLPPELTYVDEDIH